MCWNCAPLHARKLTNWDGGRPAYAGMWGRTDMAAYGVGAGIGRVPAGTNPPGGKLPGAGEMPYGGCNCAASFYITVISLLQTLQTQETVERCLLCVTKLARYFYVIYIYSFKQHAIIHNWPKPGVPLKSHIISLICFKVTYATNSVTNVVCSNKHVCKRVGLSTMQDFFVVVAHSDTIKRAKSFTCASFSSCLNFLARLCHWPISLLSRHPGAKTKGHDC